MEMQISDVYRNNYQDNSIAPKNDRNQVWKNMMCYTAASQQGVVSSQCAETLQSPSNSGEEVLHFLGRVLAQYLPGSLKTDLHPAG